MCMQENTAKFKGKHMPFLHLYKRFIGKKVRRSRLFDTTWRNIVFGFFLRKVGDLLGANEHIYILDTQDTLNLVQRYGEIRDEL